MRKYFYLISFAAVINCLVLLLAFNYSAVIVLYHLLLVFLSQILLLVLTFFLFLFIKKEKQFSLVIHALYFLNFLVLVLLFTLILSSNYFWKKTITVSVIKNYFSKFGSFVTALPIEGWLFYTSLVLLLGVIIMLYFLCRPNPRKFYFSKTHLRNRKVITYSTIAFCTMLLFAFLFRNGIMQAKRTMHFAEEPLLQFAFGNIWGEGNEVAFDQKRFLQGEKDKPCLDSLDIKPNKNDHLVVVILVDALRSDHLSFYGYNRKTTPFLDSLRSSGSLHVVQEAFSPSTGTVGGVAGLFFSRDWNEFGYNGLNIMSYLKKAGYKTYSFLTGYHRDWFGLSALYRGSSDVYYESPKDLETPPDDDLVTLEKIAETKINQRSFVYIHLLSTHTIGQKSPAFKKFFPDKIGIGTNQKTALVNNYDNGILQADHSIKTIFEKLDRENLLSNSTIYILSDHGELFGEDGRWSHGGSVHQNLISVPLLIYDSQKAWYNNLQTATLKDIAPTIVDRLAYPVPACWEGRSLHQPAQDFEMEVNSVTESDFPFGVLSAKKGTIKLSVMNENKEVKRTLVKAGNDWKEVN